MPVGRGVAVSVARTTPAEGSVPTSPFRWFAPVPGRRVVLVRSLTFAYAAAWLVVRAGYLRDVARLPERRFDPVGVLAFLDAPPGAATVAIVWVASLLSCALVVAQRVPAVAAPVGACGLFVLVTYTSSFGQVFHTEHLLALHLLVLAAATVIERPGSDGESSGWPLNLMMTIVVLTYVLAGVAKLRWSGVAWASGDVLQNWIAIDNLRKHLFGDWYSPLGGRLSTWDWVWPPLAVVTLTVELGAPLAMFAGRLRTAWLVAAWAFHLGVLVLMAISFPYQLVGVAYVAFTRAEVVEARVREYLGRIAGERRELEFADDHRAM